MRRDLVLAGATGAVVLGALAGLSRAFSGPQWRLSALAALLLALAVAATARAVRAGALASLVASAAGLAVFTYVVHLPGGPLLPGLEQLADAASLLQEGLVAFRDQPAPVPPLDGLVLIVTTGVWVVTHATHELLVRAGRVALALAPPATLWIVPLAVPMPPGRTWPQALPFLAGAGLVLLLASDSDVTDWARDTDATRPSSAGLIVGALALAVAAVAPSVVPGYGAEAWVDVATGSDPRGYQPIVDVGDRLKLPDERDVLEVRSDRRVYLRLAGLDSFDGSTWRLGPGGADDYRPDPDNLYSTADQLPPEVPIREQSPARAEITVLDLANIYVPVPYQPVEVSGPDRDEMVYSTEGSFLATWRTADNDVGGQLRVGVEEGFAYDVTSAIPTPTTEQLGDVDVGNVDEAHTQLPGDYARMREQAAQVYADADAETAIDRTLALQRWFVGDDSEFAYDLDVPELRGDEALQEFVFDTKTGYCEYYATAMAVMLRATGIPARVAVGFLPGRVTEEGDDDGDGLDTYTVGTEDAHAWVEVLFPDYGWVRFEPTPRSDGTTSTPRASDLDPELSDRELAAEQRDGDDEPTEEPDDEPTPNLDDEQRDPNLDPGETSAADEGGGGPGGSSPWAVALAALLVAAVSGVILGLRRERVPAGAGPDVRILVAQRRLLATAGGYGVGRRPWETAVETAGRWVADGRTEPGPSLRFATLSQAAAFGGTVETSDGQEAETLQRTLSAQLRDSVNLRDRLVAPLRAPVSSATTRISEVATRVRSALVSLTSGRD